MTPTDQEKLRAVRDRLTQVAAAMAKCPPPDRGLGEDIQTLLSALSEQATGEPVAGAVDNFNAGYVIACCNVFNLHGEAEIAHDVLKELGVTKGQVEAMDLSEYDTDALSKIEVARSGSVYAEKPKLTVAPQAPAEAREVDDIDVQGWAAFKGHHLPVAVARFIAENIKERAALAQNGGS